MDVQCPRCRAEYEIEPALVQKGPVRLQCSACSCTFRLQLAGTSPTVDWRVRRRDDKKVLELDGLTTLQRWIVERKVGRDDEISKSGKQWKRLGDMAELSSFFMVVDQLDHMAQNTQEALDETAAPSVPLTRSAALNAALKQSAPVEAPSLDSSIEEALDALDAESPILDGLSGGGGFEEDLASELLDAFDGVKNEEESGEKDELADALLASLAVSGFYRVPSGLQEQLEVAHREAMEADRKDAMARASQPVVEVVAPGPAANPVAQPVEDDDSEPVVTLKPKAAAPVVLVSETEPEPTPAVAPRPAPAPTPTPEPSPAIGAGASSKDDWFDNDAAANDELEYAPGKSNTVIFAVIGLVLVLGVIAFVIFGANNDKSSEAAQTQNDGAAAESTANTNATAAPSTAPPTTSEGSASANTADVQAAAVIPSLLPTDIAPDILVGASHAITSQRLAAVLDPEGDADVEPETDSGDSSPKRLTFDGAMRKAKKARERGKYKEALAAYRVALERRENNIEAISGMGWSYLSLKNHDAAIAEFKRAIAQSPRYSVAYIGLGKAYQNKGDAKQALEAYEKYLDIAPSGSQASIARAQSEKLRRKLGTDSKDSGSSSKDSGSTAKDSGSSSKDSGSSTKDSGSGSDSGSSSKDSGSDSGSSSTTDGGKKVIIKKKDDEEPQESGGKKVIIKKKDP